jgi:hypothetical protein
VLEAPLSPIGSSITEQRFEVSPSTTEQDQKMSIKPGAKSEKASAQEARAALSQELPPAVKNQFNDIFKLVDDRHYKRAIKTADAVLKKVPGHAPSMAMKALCVYNMGKKEEGHELAKTALKTDLK